MIQVDSYYFTSRLKFLKALIVRFAIARPFVLFAIIRPFVFIRFTLTMRDKFIQQVLTMPEAAEEFRKWRGIGLTRHFCI
jgi:aminoglycoside N3'-acetyltransferase